MARRLPLQTGAILSKLLTSLCLLAALIGGHSALAASERLWHAENGFRWADLAVPSSGKTGFTLLGPEVTGIAFTNVLDEWTCASNRVLENGAGVAVGDIDNDGLPDLFFCSLTGDCRLYRNLGAWKFKDVTAESGIVCGHHVCRGAVFADLNGDGNLDLLISTTGDGVLCFINDGHGKFRDETQSAGTASRHGSVTLTLADIDGNGTLDLYVANNRTEDIRDRGAVDLQMVGRRLVVPPSLQDRLIVINNRLYEYGEPDILYLNDGKAHFTPVSWTNGTFLDEDGKCLTNPPLDWGLTASFRDLNNDGFPDLYVCNDYWTPDRIWINDGHGHFQAINRLAIRHTSGSSMGVDMADIDRDGNVDIYVLDMLSRDHRLRKRQMLAQAQRPLPVGQIEDRPQILRNTLQHGRGDGTYEEIADYAGIPGSDWSWSPVFIDIDLDGYEDLVIPTGHIKDVQDLDAGEQIKARQRRWTQTKGLINYDGKLVPFQEAFTTERMINSRFYPRLETPIVGFHNLGNLKFSEETTAWGLNTPGIHHGIAMADLDNDGDLDLIVNNLNAVAGIYRNDAVAPRVAVRLKGAPPNTQGIGAKIKLWGGAVPMQSEEVISGGRYLSGSEPLLVFAAGKAAGGMTLEVAWRSGKRSAITDVHPNRLYEIMEPVGTPSTASPTSSFTPHPTPNTAPNPPASVRSLSPLASLSSFTTNQTAAAITHTFFEDVSDLLQHEHAEQPFNDFERQPLLPKRLSQLGPGVCWCDIDGDGHDDLVIGSGRGGRLGVFRNNGHGKFERLANPPGDAVLTEDQTGLVGLPQAGGKTAVLVGLSNYEDGLTNRASVRQYDFQKQSITDIVPDAETSSGPLALADIDGDGRLELFVAGRVIPGRYPESASSRIFRQNGGGWELDVQNTRVLERVGLVSGAVWSDLDGDGFPELILACEWGPIRVFKNRKGSLREITAELGLDKFTGWWSSVTTGDLDGDGKLDIVAGNWGLNSPYRATPDQPLVLFFGDLSNRGVIDLLETEYDTDTKALVPRRMLMAMSLALPALRERFPTHKAFSEATIDQILGDQRALARQVSTTTLASMVFYNRGTRFEPVELPKEAQFAPAFAVNIADFDGDGHEDIFLSQNYFATQPEIPRLDAGRGLWLQGDGKGGLRPVPGQESGIRIYGEQRGAAVADFDEDGRIDLVVTQNGAATKLLHNTSAKPGLRVRLVGPPGNPTGIGATIRLKFGQRLGPSREIHAGSGYWSQDSAVQVLATPEAPTAVWVRWPGGRVTETVLPHPALTVSIDAAGRSLP